MNIRVKAEAAKKKMVQKFKERKDHQRIMHNLNKEIRPSIINELGEKNKNNLEYQNLDRNPALYLENEMDDE